MCSIAGIVGGDNGIPVLVETLQRLEYRGYDSAGIGTRSKDPHNGYSLKIVRSEGEIARLKEKLAHAPLQGSIAIGHTRWATHGVVSEANAHPHLSHGSTVAVVHNGTIDNHESLKEELLKKGFLFRSDTDTEVLAHLIEYHMRQGCSLAQAVQLTLARVIGLCTLAAVASEGPDELVVARRGTPLIVGWTNGVEELRTFVVSDRSALAGLASYTASLHDEEVAILRRGQKPVLFDGESLESRAQPMHMVPEESHLRGFSHRMRTEIDDQRHSVQIAFRQGVSALQALSQDVRDTLLRVNRMVIVACGTSYYAGLAGQHYLQKYAGVQVEVVHAHEYYRRPWFGGEKFVIAISQSGETMDTLEAVKYAKAHGALVLGVTNREESELIRLSDGTLYLRAGVEQAVASTKAFTSQLAVLLSLARLLRAGEKEEGGDLGAIRNISAAVDQALLLDPIVADLAKRYGDAKRFVFLGKGLGRAVAYEGALKLMEVAYVDAYAAPAGELKHGPLALIEAGVPVFGTLFNDGLETLMLTSLKEVASRKGEPIILDTVGVSEAAQVATHYLRLPPVPEDLAPIVSVIVYQLFAYHVSCLKGYNPDKPRNLAKSVTV